MILGTNVLSAERLREDFDASFRTAQRAEDIEQREFVLVQAGALAAALPVTEICGIEHGAEVVAVPSRVGSLLGLAGVRGAVVPVFSLAALVGEAGGGRQGWQRKPVFALVEDGLGGRVGLGFGKLLRFVRVGPEALPASGEGTRALLRHEDELFTLVAPRELLEAVVAGTAANMKDGAQPRKHQARKHRAQERRETD